ncbi:MAG: hypothetical protein AAFV51_05885 [Pseudomonadota bacterium]
MGLIAGGGAAAVAVAAAAVFVLSRGSADGPRVPQGDEVVCLRGPAPFIAAELPQCLTAADLSRLDIAPLEDPNGGAARVTLAHPTDFDAPPATVETCAEYRPLADTGWGGLSSRDMRREQIFQRACGAIDMLKRAEFPSKSHFGGDRLSKADLETLEAPAIARLSPDAPRLDGEGLVVAKDGDWRWTLTIDTEKSVIDELAHADFDGDGLGDILVAVQLSAVGGTLSTAYVGYFTKTAPGAALELKVD